MASDGRSGDSSGAEGASPVAVIDRLLDRGEGGVVAFLFTDIESSTALWDAHPDAMARAVAVHDEVVTGAVSDHGGRVVQRVGDAMDAAFTTVEDAAEAAAAAQRRLGEVSWPGEVGALRVRMAVDVGEVEARDGRFFGSVLNRLGRILAAGHGGQVLASGEAAGRLEGSRFATVDLGEFRFKGLGRPQRVWQVVSEGLKGEFPPLRVDRPASVGRGGPVEVVGGYELVEVVGEGRLGVVYRGFQPAVGREVAVRVVDAEVANDPRFVRRFESVAQTVAGLEHPHVVTLRDFWRDPDGAYLVARWLDGGSLAETLARGPWNPQPAARVLAEVGAALGYAHRRGVVHGALSSSQVLLDAEGNAYVADFALVRELIDGQASEGDGVATDLRALGALAFELLAGRAPSEHDPTRLSALRSDVGAAVDDAVAAALGPEAAERFGSVEEFLAAVLPALEGGTVAARVALGPTRNPYKGLEAFGAADAADFFGREDLVPALIDAVGDRRLVGVVGPSGSGKSSVVRAGLIPAVRGGALEGGWVVTDLYPGSRPFAELEAALLRVAVERPGDLGATLRSGPDGLLRAVKQVLAADGSELLLVIDQFEELFALVADDEVREQFLDALVALAEDARGRARVVVTLRADFFDRPLDHPEFGRLLKDGLVPVAALDTEGLAAAIEGPARNVGVELEPGLVGEILGDVGREPGRLPLLQFALRELFDAREGSRLTLAAYRESGGVNAALARRAEEVYGELDEEVRPAARQVFLRLVTLGEGAEDTRRRVARSELTSLPGLGDAVEVVLDRFGHHRLLAFDRDATTREPTVEVAHEALLRHWRRLRRWIQEARDDLRTHRRLHTAARQWTEAGQDDAYLLSPARVEATDEWLADSPVALTDDETRFLDASRTRKHELEQAEAERAAHEQALERRARTRLRVIAGVSALAAVLAVGLSLFAFDQRSQADTQRAAAEQERVAAERSERIATARGLASAAIAQLTEDPELAVLLGLEAVAMTRDADGDVLPEAETALRRAVRTSHVRHRLEAEGGYASVDVAPDGRVATLTMLGALTVWDPETWEPLLELDDLTRAELVFYDDVEFSPDGSSFVVADDELRGAIRDTATGEVQVELEGRLARPTFSPDGRLVAGVLRREIDAFVEEDPTVAIWDATTGGIVRRIEAEGYVFTLDFSPDGSLLGSTAGFPGQPVRAWEVETGELAWSHPEQQGDVYMLVRFHPDGELVAVGMESGPVQLRDARDGELVDSLRGHVVGIQALAFSADGERLVTGDQEGTTRVWEVDGRRELLVLPGHTAPLSDAAFVPGGGHVVTTSRDGTARAWDVRGDVGHEYAVLPGVAPPIAGSSRFSPDGRYLATPGMDGARIWDVATLEESGFLPHDHAVPVVAFSPDGRLLATTSTADHHDTPPDEWVDEISIWDVASADRLLAVEQDTHYSDLAFSPDGRTLLAAGVDVVRAIDVGSGDEVFTHDYEGQVFRAAYAPDGDRIIVAGYNGGLLLDAAGELVGGIAEDMGGLADLAILDDRHVLLGDAGGEGRIGLYDPSTGEEVRTVRREGGGVRTLVEAWEDTLFIGRSETVTARDLDTGERRFELEVLAGLWSFDVSPDGRFLVTNHPAPWTYVHVAQTGDLLDLAHERLTRWWTDEECEEFLQGGCPEPRG